MKRFGVPELVPQPPQQSSDMSMVGSLGVGRLDLATATGTNDHNASEQASDVDSLGQQYNLDATYSSRSTGKRPLPMEIDDSEDEERPRTRSALYAVS